MEKARAHVMIDGKVETYEGGLKRWDEDYLYFCLPEGGEARFPKDDVELLERLGGTFVLPGKVPVTEPIRIKLGAPKAPAAAPVLKPGSAIEQVVNIIKASGLDVVKDRKKLIPMIMAATGKTEGWASTYHQNAKKYF